MKAGPETIKKSRANPSQVATAAQPRSPLPEREATPPAIGTQLQNAAQLGHHFSAIEPHSSLHSSLVLGPADDRFEQEADRAAEQAVAQIDPLAAGASPQPPALTPVSQPGVIQRDADGDSAGPVGVSGGLAGTIERARGGGQPLPAGVRMPMERAFGAPFSQVRIHSDAQAQALNRQLEARAFAVGHDIFYSRPELLPGNDGQAAPSDARDRQHLLAEELAHVRQQEMGEKRIQRQGNGRRKGVKERDPAEGLKKRRGQKAKATKEAREGKLNRRRGYAIGQHGAKTREQKRLTEAFGFKVSGDTHESEHTIGFEPLNRTSGLERGSGGRAGSLENRAPAYQEMKPMHRAHIGTGTQADPDESGFSSQTYRDAQRALIETGDVSSAVQLNQLAYAFLPGFQAGGREAGHGGEAPLKRAKPAESWERQAARDSYEKMVENMQSVTYAQGAEDRDMAVDATSRAEMYLARRAAETGDWPRAEEIDAAKKRFKVE
jgi:hypothetical protein